ncbi:sigma-54-dependent Fis family transcriptional regulator [Chromobacterium violaceum]|uniref:sigma-54-dependent transcriptional regulator n=1 Tax=Chromobacterium violaceum TaxID=536 RepID=UPI0009D9BD2C|nr:sigma-54 dependent transcriptional regulator [Chromobacterium violaceum]OQS10320.1 sigma-54-dependent Fis family transcriptional regulator [Chromobacterium violaceum]OQS29996.1 sigma-54-dependent Fis family transcriptional regulator [Chromobacterium violaceum]
MTKTLRVLIVDDEPDIRELLELTLLKMGLAPVCAGSVAEARSALDAGGFDLALTDMRLPDGEGLEVVNHIGVTGLDVPIAVITAYGSADNAVRAMKAGAFDYLQKPVSLAQLRSLVKSALKVEAPVRAVAQQRLLGESPAIQEVLRLTDKLSRSQAAVYIGGESGTGKEQAARLIHELGPRADKPFVAVNCGAIPESLMESEFFGCRKGAFTGADADRDGFFQQAQGGTLFLDEVAELPLAMQVKLLRAIQEKTVRKLGASQEEAVDARIICATHRDLAARVESGLFRQDLYYRLNVLQLRMPPLRELRDDIPLFAERLLQRFGGASAPQLSADARRALQDYAYPGNFRELENILERAVALAAGPALSREDLQLTPCAEHAPEPGSGEPLQDYLDRVEREAIVKALEGTRYNRTQAAKKLGVTFRSLRYRMERLGVK